MDKLVSEFRLWFLFTKIAFWTYKITLASMSLTYLSFQIAAGLMVWNSVPVVLFDPLRDIDTFRQLLKTSTKGTMDPEDSARNSCNSWTLYAR